MDFFENFLCTYGQKDEFITFEERPESYCAIRGGLLVECFLVYINNLLLFNFHENKASIRDKII